MCPEDAQGFHCCLKFQPLENRMGFSGPRLTPASLPPQIQPWTSSLTSHKEAEKAHLASQGPAGLLGSCQAFSIYSPLVVPRKRGTRERKPFLTEQAAQGAGEQGPGPLCAAFKRRRLSPGRGGGPAAAEPQSLAHWLESRQ